MSLIEVASYRRRLGVSEERVFENVHDWEHLPSLHASSFRGIRCSRADATGWRAQLAPASGPEFEMELRFEPDGRSYHARTLSGAGAGIDIWTHVASEGPRTTHVEVKFLAPNVPAQADGKLGAAFVQLYTRLWDEDEAMMQHRQAFLDGVVPRPPRPGARAPKLLGSAAALSAQLPLAVDADGDAWLVRQHEGRFVAHAAACPHWGAPLAGARIDANAVVCPWHGYRFDLSSGRGPASQRCRMPARAEVRVSERDEAWLVIS